MIQISFNVLPEQCSYVPYCQNIQIIERKSYHSVYKCQFYNTRIVNNEGNALYSILFIRKT